MSELEKLEKAVVDTEAAVDTACGAIYTYVLASSPISDHAQATANATVDAWNRARIELRDYRKEQANAT
tara:strand:+ start:571 stop:777 length:207 start_codon:yes stop_codon:yes gene_type:complete